MTWILTFACVLATLPAGLRWIRVAQREHYLPPNVSRFAWRWLTSGALNLALLGVGLAGVIGTLTNIWFGFLVAAVQIGPVGLTLKGSTSPLVWTGRLRRLVFATGLAVVVIYLAGALTAMPLVVVLGLFLLPMLVDAALFALTPIENRLSQKWVDKAKSRLDSMDVDVVAITGSYGKTTTKNYVAHLLEGSHRTVASPASFNNRMGLARAINENLTPGTDVFVAEMGTYGPGEIAELCEWIVPKVAAIVAIGPVHLERFGTEERIVEAKSEILDRAQVGVINVEHPLLAQLAQTRSDSMQILRVSSSGGRIEVDGLDFGEAPDGVFEANLAVAVGIGIALGIPRDVLRSRFPGLPAAEHRQSLIRTDSDVTIIDDTFNSHPVGARRALETLATVGVGRRVVVTPGMVELGSLQHEANRDFAEMASRIADWLIIVGKTNRRALVQGSSKGDASVTVVSSRQEAVAWVRANLGPGDAVLYENDLPDHYP